MNFDNNAILHSGRYHDGDPAQGIASSIVTARFANVVTDELIAIIAAGGLTPDINTVNQVLTAIQLLIETAKTEAINQAKADIIGGAPAALDTLIELSAALNNDASLATNLASQIATKLTISNNLSDLLDIAVARANLNVFSQIESDTRFTRRANNLSDLADTSIARTNLGVLSTAETNSAITAAVNALVGGAPAALDTLNELAAAINDDASIAATLGTQISSKLTASSNLSDLTNTTAARSNLGVLSTAETNSAIAAAINALIGGAPAALDTLNELAAAINDDASIAATLSAQIATKATVKTVSFGSSGYSWDTDTGECRLWGYTSVTNNPTPQKVYYPTPLSAVHNIHITSANHVLANFPKATLPSGVTTYFDATNTMSYGGSMYCFWEAIAEKAS